MKVYKFTTRKLETGHWAIGEYFDLLYNKVEVGSIESRDHNVFSLTLRVKASQEALAQNPNCPFMNRRVKQRFASREEARVWCNDNVEALLGQLYFDAR